MTSPSHPSPKNKVITRRAFLGKSILGAAGAALVPLILQSRFREDPAGDLRRLQAVMRFADQVLKQGRDQWSGENTPLFADGLDLSTGRPVVWKFGGEEFILSNLASQQNLLRTLVSLSRLTGEEKYRAAAEETVHYHFDHLASPCGLLRWGGHQFIDLRTLQPVGGFDVNCHEFKNSLPYYAFLHEVNPEATARLIRAVWDAHITDWSILNMNRHGEYLEGREVCPLLWERDFDDPDPFFEAPGLTFVNAGNDMIFSAAQLYALHGEEGALTWARRMADLYVRSRHPDTGLGSYQYSKPLRRNEPIWPMTETYHTWANYGDRAENQFGHEFGDTAREAWVLFGGRVRVIYVNHALVMLDVAGMLEEEGRDFLDWTVEGLAAFLKHAYDEERNEFRPLWADGTDLSGREIETFGYYNRSGGPRPFSGNPGDSGFLLSFARAQRLSGDPRLWRGLRGMFRGNGLGELGERTSDSPRINPASAESDPLLIHALLELYRVEPHAEFLALARQIGDNILTQRMRDGFFVPTQRHFNANFNADEPLALLALHAVLTGRADAVPPYIGSRGYLHGTFDGAGRTYDFQVIYGQTDDD